MRDQIEAARPRNSVQQMREQARQSGPPPLFNLNTVMAPIQFNQASLRDIFSSIAKSTQDQHHVRQHVPGSRLHR